MIRTVIALSLLAGPALAQTGVFTDSSTLPMISNGVVVLANNLQRAVTICEHHARVGVGPDGRLLPEFDQEWSACFKIRDAWRNSKTPRNPQPAYRADKGDADFVNGVAKTLK